jgi:hypothetical protein
MWRILNAPASLRWEVGKAAAAGVKGDIAFAETVLSSDFHFRHGDANPGQLSTIWFERV